MERKLAERLDHYFWWFIWLLPLIGAVVCYFMGDSHTFSEFASFIGDFRFAFIGDILDDIESVTGFAFPAILKSYASYVVSVEIIHVFVDFMVFLPRLCHKLAEPSTYDFGGKMR